MPVYNEKFVLFRFSGLNLSNFKFVLRSELDETSKQIRNFIVFSDEATLNENFPKREQNVPKNKFCVITGLPAKYFDPNTQCPYANLYAYKILKDLYKQKQTPKA